MKILDQIVRQKDPALKFAVERFTTGHVSAALDALQKQGRVREITDAEERHRAIARIGCNARLADARRVEFDANNTVTLTMVMHSPAHSSQGFTAKRVLINADMHVHPDLVNSRFGYVSISRARHEATVFTNDLAKLSQQLSADASKTSALEIQAQSISGGIRMGV